MALVPEVRGFDDVVGLEDKLRMFSRAVASIMKREFPGFNLWAELRIGGTANDAGVAGGIVGGRFAGMVGGGLGGGLGDVGVGGGGGGSSVGGSVGGSMGGNVTE